MQGAELGSWCSLSIPQMVPFVADETVLPFKAESLLWMQASGSASVLDRSAAVGFLRMREHSSTISYTVSSSPASHGKVKCVRRLCYTSPSLLRCSHSQGKKFGVWRSLQGLFQSRAGAWGGERNSERERRQAVCILKRWRSTLGLTPMWFT